MDTQNQNEHVLDYHDYLHMHDIVNAHSSHVVLFRYFVEEQEAHVDAYLSHNKLRETRLDTRFGIAYVFPSGLAQYLGISAEE